MTSSKPRTPPPDQAARIRALDASRSILVRAPAGSGKTDLLTRRFLQLLAEVDEPDQIVAITFTKAAAAEMRHRILSELEKAADHSEPTSDPFSMEALAQRALARSRALGWNLIDLPAQLRISTIDSFCRELALQRPLLSGLGGGLDISEEPTELYRRAARRTLEQIGSGPAALNEAIQALLLWRDNSWQEVETELVEMLKTRDRWMHDFVVGQEPDWESLRDTLEAPFSRAAREALAAMCEILDSVPGACNEAHALARFACQRSDGALYQDLAELAEFPVAPLETADQVETAIAAFACLAQLLLTDGGKLRKRIDNSMGFPKEFKSEKARMMNLIEALGSVPGFEGALGAMSGLPPARYTEDEWQIVRACFVLLRHAAGELEVVFAETGTADYIQVAQIAQNVLRGDDGLPSEAAFPIADGVRHLLVDEFQDTSRRQHQFLASLIAAWTEREGRTCFVVGDPMQSIYYFRGADAELFPRVEQLGLEIPGDDPQRFELVQLSANFRTAAQLVAPVNETFAQVFAASDGSHVTFTQSQAVRDNSAEAGLHLVSPSAERLQLHLEFSPRSASGAGQQQTEEIRAEREAARQKQTEEMVALIRDHMPRVVQARAAGEKYRIAVLGRARSALAPIAAALRQSGIPFRAVELEQLQDRPEIVDALSLARALLNPQDRVAWLGVLRAPWCGLSLADLHALTSADDPALLARPVPELMAERINLLSDEGRIAVARVLRATESANRLRSMHPEATPATWLEQVWLRLGAADCVDATGRDNLDLLWSSIDSLADGEPGLLGPALQAALSKLTAQPDPSADSDCGVQLMTIHKSKGLEFEVVVVPDLQAKVPVPGITMLSWLERGLSPDADRNDPLDAREITEFLVAPLPQKGYQRGHAKAWVDRVRRERESQEMRRILYVAATRAREELHFFARPEFKTEKNGALALSDPKNSLLATAWPAFEKETRERFESWKEAATGSSTIESLAAGAAEAPAKIPTADPPTRLHRLPPDYRAAQNETAEDEAASRVSGNPLVGGRLYERHEGGLHSRALGRAVHLLLDRLAQLAATRPWEDALSALSRLQQRAAAEARPAGIDEQQADRIATQALDIAHQAAADPTCRWILSPHADGASEVRWTAVVSGRLHTVQVDRVFRAGNPPQIADDSDGRETWWIIDYKTAHLEGLDSKSALPELRRIFASQLEAYAAVLRNLHGSHTPVRAGLYYPRMKLLDSWDL